MDIGFARYSGLLDMGEEEFAEACRGQTAFDVGVIKIGAGEVTELFDNEFILVAGKSRG